MTLKLSYGANDYKLFYTYYLSHRSYSGLHIVISWWIMFWGTNSDPCLGREVVENAAFRRYNNSASLKSSKNVHIFWYSMSSSSHSRLMYSLVPSFGLLLPQISAWLVPLLLWVSAQMLSPQNSLTWSSPLEESLHVAPQPFLISTWHFSLPDVLHMYILLSLSLSRINYMRAETGWFSAINWESIKILVHNRCAFSNY